MPDPALTACGLTMAALRGDDQAVALLLDGLTADQLRAVTHTALMALAAGVRHAPGGPDIVAGAVDQLRATAYQLATEGDC